MAVRFDASGEAYTRAISLGATTQFSISCWLKISVDRNALSSIWSLDNGFASGYALLQTDTDGTTLLYSDGSANRTLGSLTVGTWCYVGIAVNGANGTAVLQRTSDATATATTWSNGQASTNADTLRICASVFSGQFLNGCVAAFKIWTGATLSQAELEAEIWAYVPRRTANVKSWYPLLAAETVDFSGNAQTLSGGSGTTTEDGPPISWRSRTRTVIVPPAAASVTGDLAATLPPLTASATGTVEVAGQLAAALPPIGASLTAVVDTTAVLAATLPPLTATLSGDVSVNLLDATLPPLTASLTADVTVDGTLNAQLPALTTAIAGEVEIPPNDITVTSSGPVRGWAAGSPGDDWATGDSARAWASSSAARSWNADGAARAWSALPPTS
ncbi:hypothetical protein ACIBQ1_09810 [Nonomuraea sp. NPDC050153]|uniref:hypothetical protein n=1 Tax=Nonomuraea sp. NPDC050153 TaxID=3364359 RepID=UPI0037B24569